MLASVLCSFIVIGDWGRRGQFYQQNIADLISKVPKDGVISVGDNFYPDGISNVMDPHQYESWYDIYEPDVPWYVSLGNHDHRGDASAQTKIDLPWWNMPDHVYEFELCGHSFVVLDSTAMTDEKWELAASLLSKDNPKKWLVAHHPIYSAGYHHNVPEEYSSRVKELYKKYNVQAILSGHDHNLQYIEHEQIRQIVSGAGSSSYHVQVPQQGLEFMAVEPGIFHIHIDVDKITILAKGLDGVLFEKTI